MSPFDPVIEPFKRLGPNDMAGAARELAAEVRILALKLAQSPYESREEFRQDLHDLIGKATTLDEVLKNV